MKSAHYSLSDSETETKDSDNDDLIFGTELIKLRTSDEQISNNISNSPKKKAEVSKFKRSIQTIKKIKNQKPEKRKKIEIVKQLKPLELMKSVSVVIDSSLINHNFGSELLAALHSADIRYNVQEQKISSTVAWIIETDQSELQFFKDYIIFVWTWKDLIRLIGENNLTLEVMEKKKCSAASKMTVIIYGIEEYFRVSKSSKNRELNLNYEAKDRPSNRNKKNESIPILSRIDVELAVGELQILNLQYKFIETGQELGLYIAHFTKALTELPLKLERNKRLECADWYVAGDSKDCVRVDANGNGFLNLWLQQICQFPNVTLDIAQAIVSKYKSPRILIKAFNTCSSKEEAELLLQDIPVRRIHGPLASVRRIGPELSKKIHQFFCGEDSNALLW